MTVAYLANMANDLLDAAQDALVEATTGHEPPGQAWVNHGEPAADFCCDGGQVTVHLETVDHSPVGDFAGALVPPSQSCARTPVATFVIELFRCVPGPDNQGNPPSATAQADAAESLLGDLWALLTELYDRAGSNAADCSLFPSAPATTCSDVNIGVAQPVSPETEGGCGGWRIPVSVVLNDPGPVGS